MKSVKSFLKNRKGSALAITAVMMVVLALLVSVLLTCASYALNHAYAMYARQQAYFSARSAAIQFKNYIETGEFVTTKDGQQKQKPFTNFAALTGKTVVAKVNNTSGNEDPHFGEVRITTRAVTSASHAKVGDKKYKVTAVGTYSLGDKVYQNAASVYIFDDYKVEFKGNRNMVSSASGLITKGNGEVIQVISLDYDPDVRDPDTLTHMYSPSSFTYMGKEQGGKRSTLNGYVLAGDVSKGIEFGANIPNAVTVTLDGGSGYNANVADMLGIYVDGNISMKQGNWLIDGDVYCSGNFEVARNGGSFAGNNCHITGNVYVGGNCVFSSGFTVDKKLYVGGNFTAMNGCKVGTMGTGDSLMVGGAINVNNDFQLNGIVTTGAAIEAYGGKDFSAVLQTMTTELTEKIQSGSSTYKVNKDKCENTKTSELKPLNFKYDDKAKCIYIDESGILTADLNNRASENNAFVQYMKSLGYNGPQAHNYFENLGKSTLVVDTGCSADGTQKTIVLYVDDNIRLDMINGSGDALFNNLGIVGDGQLIIVLGENSQIWGGNKSSNGYDNNSTIGYIAKNGSGTYADYSGQQQYPYERALRRSEINPNANLKQARSYVKMDSLYNSRVAGSADTNLKKQVLKDIEPEIYILSAYKTKNRLNLNDNIDQIGQTANVFFQGLNYSGYMVTSDYTVPAGTVGVVPNSAVAIRSVDISGCVFTDHFVYATSGGAKYTFIPADDKFKDNLITPNWVNSTGSDDDTKPDYENKKIPISQSELFKNNTKSVGVTTKSVSNASTYDGVSSAFYAY